VDLGNGVGGAIVKGGKLYQSPLPLCGELGHTPVAGNRRRCGCGAQGCVETLLSRAGLLKSFAEAEPQQPQTWAALARSLERPGVPVWLAASLDSGAAVIAGALNVLGLRQVVLTGHLSELPASVTDYLRSAVNQAAMWARFGAIICETAPRQRAAGLAAAGMDRLLVPASHQEGIRSHLPSE
jgi:predicted NBD/HSP70 family sugar kinase